MASSDFAHLTEYEIRGDVQEPSDEKELSQECKDLLLSLPKEKGWRSHYLYLFHDFWCSGNEIQSINTFTNNFQAKDTDVVVASIPKSGTTWLKALTFSILYRQRFTSFENHPLLTSNPHQLVPIFEYGLYGEIQSQFPHPSNMIEPRLFGTHIPFHALVKSIKELSNGRIIYICRNPFDTFISYWNYANNIKPKDLHMLTLEEAFEKYIKGIYDFGPWWNHTLGYWKESIARPDKVLFLKYEDLKEDVNFNVKRVAEFLGCPFTEEEESSGVIESIIKLCSFQKMKDLEVNKFGALSKTIENKHFFRKAKIGDWKNYLSSSMVEKLSEVIEKKLSGSGLSFRVHS
ncbi:hypothetical protein VNO77_39310 [Canavalia gladiata]|uniref:Sulfotransferase n=1 Tax=Canavalia gladiata TaxID=3824 RepID=A0AAN9KAV0_CANGL